MGIFKVLSFSRFVYNTVLWSIITLFCIRCPGFIYLLVAPLYPYEYLSYFPNCQLLFSSLFMSLAFLDSIHKWYHTVEILPFVTTGWTLGHYANEWVKQRKTLPDSYWFLNLSTHLQSSNSDCCDRLPVVSLFPSSLSSTSHSSCCSEIILVTSLPHWQSLFPIHLKGKYKLHKVMIILWAYIISSRQLHKVDTIVTWNKSKSCSVLSDSLWPHGVYSP